MEAHRGGGDRREESLKEEELNVLVVEVERIAGCLEKGRHKLGRGISRRVGLTVDVGVRDEPVEELERGLSELGATGAERRGDGREEQLRVLEREAAERARLP